MRGRRWRKRIGWRASLVPYASKFGSVGKCPTMLRFAGTRISGPDASNPSKIGLARPFLLDQPDPALDQPTRRAPAGILPTRLVWTAQSGRLTLVLNESAVVRKTPHALTRESHQRFDLGAVLRHKAGRPRVLLSNL